jgi:hypothetical protein
VIARSWLPRKPRAEHSAAYYLTTSLPYYLTTLRQVVLPSEEDEDHSCLAAAVHLTDDEGEVSVSQLVSW